MTVLDWAIVAFTIALGPLGLPPGADRRNADPDRLRGRGVRRAAGSAPLVLYQGSASPYAPLCAALGALRRRRARRGHAGEPRSRTALAGDPRQRRAAPRRRGRWRGPDRLGRAGAGLGLRRGGSCTHRGPHSYAPTSRSSVILRSLNEVLPPSGPVLQRARPGRPGAVDHRAGGTGAAPDPAIATDPDVLERAAARWCGCSAPPAGSASRARAGRCGPGLIVTNAHVVAGADDTTVTTPGRGRARRDAASTTTPRTTWRCCGSAPTCRPCRSPTSASSGAGGGGARLPGERALLGRAGPPRRDPRHDQRGLLRARADRPHDHLPARQRPQRQLRWAAGRRSRQRPSASSSPPPPPARPAASRSRPRRSSKQPRRGPRRRSDDRSLHRLSDCRKPITYVQ